MIDRNTTDICRNFRKNGRRSAYVVVHQEIMACEQRTKSAFRVGAPVAICTWCAAVLAGSCTGDDFDRVMRMETVSAEVLVAGSSPVPGNNGTITVLSTSTDSILLIWSRAVDNRTPQADLEYRLYRSDFNNIGTVLKAELNGTAVTGWTVDMVTALADGLSPGTTYCFNVLVKNGAGIKSAYTIISATTNIIIY